MFKLSVVTRGAHESIYNGVKIEDRANAIRVFDAIRQAARTGIAHRGWTAYESVHLLADTSDVSNLTLWESADSEFPFIVDGESFPLSTTV